MLFTCDGKLTNVVVGGPVAVDNDGRVRQPCSIFSAERDCAMGTTNSRIGAVGTRQHGRPIPIDPGLV